MFGVASVVAFAVALLLQLADVHKGHLLTVATFVIIGLLCLAVHGVGGAWWPSRRSP